MSGVWVGACLSPLLCDPVGFHELIEFFAVKAKVTTYPDLGELTRINQPLQVVIGDLKRGGDFLSL